MQVVFLTLLLALLSPSAVANGAQVLAEQKTQAIAAKVYQRLEKDLSAKKIVWGAQAYIRIFKQEHQLELWLLNAGRFELFKTYTICDYSGGLGPKRAEGDKQAPEGFYYIGPKDFNPYSKAHLSLDIGYPNSYDRKQNFTGSLIKIHGGCISTGCFTLGENKHSEHPRWDTPIEEIYTLSAAAIEHGQRFIRVHIFPFRMEAPILQHHLDSEHHAFWLNLKEGYDFFNTHGIPPNVTTIGNRYSFSMPDEYSASGRNLAAR